MSNEIKIIISGEDQASQVVKAFERVFSNASKEVQQQAKNTSDKINTHMAQAERHVKGFSEKSMSAFKLLAGYLAGAGILGALKDVGQAYADQENAINKMSVAMKNQGSFSQAALQDMVAYSGELQKTSTIADEAALAVMANLKSYGMLDEEVKKATKVALDFAAAKKDEGMTVTTASELIGKAYMGQTSTLSRYGIVIDDTIKGAEKFDAVMTQLQQRFGGAAAAELDTYAGQVANLGNQWGDVKEDIGQVSTGIQVMLMPTLRELIGLAKEATEGMVAMFSSTKEAQIRQRQVELQDELERLQGSVTAIEGLDQAGSSGMFGRIWGAFFGDDSQKAKDRIKEINDELDRLARQQNELNRGSAQVQPGGSRTARPSGDEEALKLAKDNAKDLKDAYGVLAQTMADDMFPAQEKVNRMIDQGNKYWAEQQKQLYETQNLIKEHGWEDYAEGLNDVGEGTRNLTKLTIDHTKIAEKTWKDQEEFAKQAARNMQDAFATFFFDAMSGDLDNFSDYWGSFWDSMKTVFANTLAEMALSWASSELRALLNPSGSDSIVGNIGSYLGAAWSVVSDYGATALDFVSSLFHEGGLVGGDNNSILNSGLAPDEVVAILQKGEYVVPKDVVSAFFGSTPDVEGPPNATMTGLQAFGLLGMAMAVGPIGAGITSGTILGTAIALGKLGKAISTIIGIESGHMTPIQSQMPFHEALSILHSTEAYGEAPAPSDAMSISEAMGILGEGSYGGTGDSYGGGSDTGFGGFGGYAYGGMARGPESGYWARLHGDELVVSQKASVPAKIEGGGPITVTVPVYIDGKLVSETVYDGIYDASKRGRITLHPRGQAGYYRTAGIDL